MMRIGFVVMLFGTGLLLESWWPHSVIANRMGGTAIGLSIGFALWIRAEGSRG